jgi:signal peptidase II
LKTRKDFTVFFIIAALIIVSDQWVKHLISSNFSLYESREVIKGIFNLTYLTNTGAAFGFMAGAGRWHHLFFQLVGFIALGGLFYLYASSAGGERLLLWGCSLVFGGAAGNLVDRIRFQKVVDFLDFHIGPHHWPAFNIADSAITVGGFLLAVFFLKNSGQN